jgi:hypothetical protein
MNYWQKLALLDALEDRDFPLWFDSLLWVLIFLFGFILGVGVSR